MQKTTNYGLNKPESTDYYDVLDFICMYKAKNLITPHTVISFLLLLFPSNYNNA